MGLWATLSEECVVPKGSDEGFTEKLHQAQKGSKVMLRVKGQAATEGFAIEHFAGSVTYTTKLWLDKNKDPLNGDLVVNYKKLGGIEVIELVPPGEEQRVPLCERRATICFQHLWPMVQG